MFEFKLQCFHGREMWTLNVEDLRRLERIEASILYWMSGVSVHEHLNMNEVIVKLGIRRIRYSVQEKR